MNLFDFYFKQIVTQGVLDWVFENAQSADHNLATDTDMVGIADGLSVTENHLGADRTVDINGPGTAYAKDGARTYIGDTYTNLDCTQDEYGVPTDPGGGNERYLSVFVRFKRRLEDMVIDGNSLPVYTRQYEDAEVFLRMGSSAAIGAAIPPALLTDALLLSDILVVGGFASIQNVDISVPRREDWYRFYGASLGHLSFGTAKEAIDWQINFLDSLAVSFPFSFTSQWLLGPSSPYYPEGPTPPVSTVQEALDAIVYDLSQTGAWPGASRVGVATFTSPGGFVTWPVQDLMTTLTGIATALDQHIAGSPPQHPASSITYVDAVISAIWGFAPGSYTDVQAMVDALATLIDASAAGTAGTDHVGVPNITGTPESLVAPNRMTFAIQEIFNHLNDRTERGEYEVLGLQNWEFRNQGPPITSEHFLDANTFLRVSSLIGGSANGWTRELNSDLGSDYAPYFTDDQGGINGITFGSQMVDFCGGRAPASLTSHGETKSEPLVFVAFYDAATIMELDPRGIRLSVNPGHNIVADIGTNRVLRIVNNADYIYVLTDDGGAGASMNLYCYDFDTWTLQWSRNIPASCGTTGITYTTKMEYVNNGTNGGCLILAGRANLASGLALHYIESDNSLYNFGSGNSSGGITDYATDFTYNSKSGEVFVTANTPEVFSAAFPSMGAGSYGPYASTAVLTSIQSDGENVWFVQDGTGHPNATIKIGVWNLSSAIDINRYQEMVGEFFFTDSATNRGSDLCYDGKRMWLGFFDLASVRHPGGVNRRGAIASWKADTLPEYWGATMANNGIYTSNERFFCTPVDRDDNWPNAGAVGRIMHLNGYTYTLFNWQDAAYSWLARIPGSLWR